MLWRLVISPRITESLTTIRSSWTHLDVLIANELLDAFEAAERAAAEKAHSS